jgi:DNA-directed RNA polymerase subunit N (RpoN/RPB10)
MSEEESFDELLERIIEEHRETLDRLGDKKQCIRSA